MNSEATSHFMIPLVVCILILQVYGGDTNAKESLNDFVPSTQKSQYSADTKWKRNSITKECKLNSSLISGTPGDCLLLDLHGRKPASHIVNVTWRKDNILMGMIKGGDVTTCEIYSKRCRIFINGSLSLCPTQLGDSGQYLVAVFTEDGIQLYNRSIQLVLTELKLKPKKTIHFILRGVYVVLFLVIVVSSIYHFGKRKKKIETQS